MEAGSDCAAGGIDRGAATGSEQDVNKGSGAVMAGAATLANRTDIAMPANQRTTVTAADWKAGLPAIGCSGFTLRELRLEDARTLFAVLATDEVSRFISPPPASVEGFERFIQWTERERRAGTYACFAVVPDGMTSAVGLFQLRALDRAFSVAEWGFALGSDFWGSGIFIEGARHVVDFAIDVIGVQRLEARAAAANGRGNGALRKVGAVQEGLLRRSFERNGTHHDQVLWGILAADWRLQRVPQQPHRLIN
jgi:RimJ/RimL family protein N-acetyltransferase